MKQEIGKLVLYSSGVGQQDTFLNDGLFDDDFQLPLPPPSGGAFDFPGGHSPRLGGTDGLDLFGDSTSSRNRSESLGIGHASPLLHGMPARAQRVDSFGLHASAGHQLNHTAGPQDAAAASPAGFISTAVSATGDLLASGVQKLKASFAWNGPTAPSGTSTGRGAGAGSHAETAAQSARSYASASSVYASTAHGALGPGQGIQAGQAWDNSPTATATTYGAAGKGASAGSKRAGSKALKHSLPTTSARAPPSMRSTGLHAMQVEGDVEEEVDFDDVDTGLGSPSGGSAAAHRRSSEYSATVSASGSALVTGGAARKAAGGAAGGGRGLKAGLQVQVHSADGGHQAAPLHVAGKKRSAHDSGFDESEPAPAESSVPSVSRGGKLHKGGLSGVASSSSVASGLDNAATALVQPADTVVSSSHRSGAAGSSRPAVLESLLLRQGDPTRSGVGAGAGVGVGVGTAGSSIALSSPMAPAVSSASAAGLPDTFPAASTGISTPSVPGQRGKGKGRLQQQGQENARGGSKGSKSTFSAAQTASVAPSSSPFPTPYPPAQGPAHPLQAYMPGMHMLHTGPTSLLQAAPSAREVMMQAQLQQQAKQLDGLIAENAALREHLRRLDQQGVDAVGVGADGAAQPGGSSWAGMGSSASSGAAALATAQSRDAAGKGSASRPAVAAIAGAHESDRQAQLSKLLAMVSARASDADVARAMAEYKDTWGDFGKERWNALRWHLRSLKGLLLPNQITRLCMWSIEHADDKGRVLAPSAAGNAADASGITSHAAVWQTICSICQISPEQSARLLSLRHSIARARRDFTETLLLLRGLEEKVTHNFTSLEMHMTGLMSIMTPRQAAIFLQWNEGSERLFQMLPSLAAWPIQLNAQGQPIFHNQGPAPGQAATAASATAHLAAQASGPVTPTPAHSGGLAALLPAVLQAALGGMAARGLGGTPVVTAAPSLPGSATGAVLLRQTAPIVSSSASNANIAGVSSSSSNQSVQSEQGEDSAAGTGGEGGGDGTAGWCASGNDPSDPTDVFRVC